MTDKSRSGEAAGKRWSREAGGHCRSHAKG